MNRSDSLKALAEFPLDVLVIGGGIVGAGVARDAAMRGLRVGLVEQKDFASGTSSRSSRLLHGGIRYLAQGRLGLVHEASVEKKIIHHIAPHLAEPLPFLFPTYRTNKNWVLWQLKIGVKIYDLLCGGKNFGKSSALTPEETLQRAPKLRAENLVGAVRYYDGFTNDARLVLDTLQSAAAHGAVLLNYCRFRDATKKAFWECAVEEALTGQKLIVQAHSIVNAAGPWAGTLPHSRVKLRLTKGVHVVVDRQRLPVPDAVVLSEGKRILFAIPWGDRTILGTTDTDHQGAPEDVRPEAADIHYILEVANRFFPQARLSDRDIVSSWAGLRPLLADPHGRPSDISRSHQIRNPEPGWWDVAGGKLTTYRLMAEQTVDKIIGELKASNVLNRNISPCRTAAEPLLPLPPRFSGILPPEFCRQAVQHFCANEWAVHLDDVMVRRAGWYHYFNNARERAMEAAEWMGECLGWSQSVRSEEIARLNSLHRIDFMLAV